ncbi:MAG: hypothetical protein AAF989_15575 [Planctomycetota bacterium]
MNTTSETSADDPKPAHPTAPSRWRLGLGVVIVFVLVVTALTVPIPFEARVAAVIGDLVHAPLFACLTWLTLRSLRRWGSLDTKGQELTIGRELVRVGVVIVLFFTFGVVMEFIQGLLGRSAAIHDAVSNGLGALAGGCWYLGTRFKRLTLRLMAVGVIGIAQWSPALIIIDVIRKPFDFPRLASFETNAEMTRWHFSGSEGMPVKMHATDGKRSMRIVFRPGRYPSATMVDMYGDWSAALSVEFDVTVDDVQAPPTLNFVFKTLDHDHLDYHSDTFRQTIELRRGESYHVKVSLADVLFGPDDREMDLSRMKYLSFQVLQPDVDTVVYVDNIRVAN